MIGTAPPACQSHPNGRSRPKAHLKHRRRAGRVPCAGGRCDGDGNFARFRPLRRSRPVHQRLLARGPGAPRSLALVEAGAAGGSCTARRLRADIRDRRGAALRGRSFLLASRDLHTSVANATFLATLAPVWVALGSGLFLGESVEAKVFFGLTLCLVGAAALIGDTWSINPSHLDGDLYGGRDLVLLRRLFPRSAARAARLWRRPNAVSFERRHRDRAPRRGNGDRGHDVAADAVRRRGASRDGVDQPRRRTRAALLCARAPAGSLFVAGDLPRGCLCRLFRLADPRRAGGSDRSSSARSPSSPASPSRSRGAAT